MSSWGRQDESLTCWQADEDRQEASEMDVESDKQGIQLQGRKLENIVELYRRTNAIIPHTHVLFSRSASSA